MTRRIMLRRYVRSQQDRQAGRQAGPCRGGSHLHFASLFFASRPECPPGFSWMAVSPRSFLTLLLVSVRALFPVQIADEDQEKFSDF